MNTNTINKINEKLKVMPDDVVDDILKYLDFLNFEKKDSDWQDDLSDLEHTLIKQGQDDLINNRTYSHQEALELIQHHINAKRL